MGTGTISRSSTEDADGRRREDGGPDGVVVGRVRKAHGVRGEVAVEVFSDVAERFDVGGRLVARLRGGEARTVIVASARPHAQLQLLRFEGCEDRGAAEQLRSATLEVDRSQVPPSASGAFYYYELIGCRCVDRRSGALGRVIDVIEDGGGLLLELESVRGRLLVPFVQIYLVSVDIGLGVIELDLPENLVEMCTSTS